MYQGELLSTNLANFGFGVSAEYHFVRFAAGKLSWLRFLSVGTGIEAAPDYVKAVGRTGDEAYLNMIMEIPLRLNGVFRPGNLFMLEPYAGVHFNIPLYWNTTPAPVSWNAGFQFGMKAGPGVAYADIRYAMDFGDSGLSAGNSDDDRRYKRHMFRLGIGYKYDLIGMIQELVRSRTS